MNSLERVTAAVSHQQPDRIPLDLGSSFTTGITRNAYMALSKGLGLHDSEPKLYDVVQQLCCVKEDILKALEVDTRGIIPNMMRKNPEIIIEGDCRSFKDEWGITWSKPRSSPYFNAVSSELSGDISVTDIENFPWPDTSGSGLFEGLVERAKSWNRSGYAVILECICAGIFEMCCRVRGVEQFYMDLAMNPALAEALLDKFVELKINFYKSAAKHIGPYVQFIREGDDVAGQENLLISPQMYRNLIKPRHRLLFEAQKKFFPEPFFVWFHSDGAIYDILPDFIEIGVEVLNPLQLTAKGMDAKRIKSEYGMDLAFWGAGVNTQQILPCGSADHVRSDVGNRIKMLKDNGGFVFATVHNIQDDVPAENILAMIDTFKQNRGYVL